MQTPQSVTLCSLTMDLWRRAYLTTPVRHYYETKSIVQVKRRLLLKFNVSRHSPIISRTMILGWIRMFQASGSVTNTAHGVPRNVHIEENFERVREFSSTQFTTFCSATIS
jgi:hypothetical protein